MKTFDLIILTIPDGTNVVTIENNQMTIPQGTKVHLRLKFKSFYYADVVKRAILADGLMTFVVNNWVVPYEIVNAPVEAPISEDEEIRLNDAVAQTMSKRKKKQKKEDLS